MKVELGNYDDIERVIDIRLDEWDTYNTDSTIAYIVAPLLKQLRDNTHGSPYVDPDDVPVQLKPTETPDKDNDYVDNTHHERWKYVLNEMIFAMEMINYDWEEQFYKFEDCEPSDDPNDEGWLGRRCVYKDDEGVRKFDWRISNGCRLFGKYFRNLWD